MVKKVVGDNEFVPISYKNAFDVMMNSTEDSVYFKDRDSRFIFVSDAQARRLNEKDKRNIIGKDDFDYFPKEDAQLYRQQELEIMNTGEPIFNREELTVWANGERTWFKVSRYPLYDAEKNIIGTWGISTDITAQKDAEFQLREEEERFRILADVTIEGVFIHTKGIIKDLNPAMLKMFGYTREEIMGKHLLDFVYDKDRDIVSNCLTRESSDPYEIRAVRSNGEVFYAEVEGRRIDIQGSDLRMAAIRDLTQRKQAIDALRESETRMRIITDSANDAIVMMDQLGSITYWNPAAERIFGYTTDEAMGANLHWLIVPERYLEKHVAAFPIFEQTGKGNAVGKTLDMDGLRKDGTEVSIQLSLSAVKMKTGWHSIGIMRDVTKQKQNELELIKAKVIAEEATGAKSEFLANMSHEIRTPMNAIIGFSGLVRKTDMTPKQQSYINKIDTSAKSLLGIINDILDFSKIEAGKLTLESVEFSLTDVINNIAGMFSERAAEKNIELLNKIAGDVPEALVGDPLRLGQILTNLVSNSIKFTEKGHVLIKTELVQKDDARCVIKFSVNDTGIGLTEEQRGNLFSAFSQADSSVTRRFGGTGLGLTISKQLVEMMKGEIAVESEFGVGSTFYFTIGFLMQTQNIEKIPANIEDLKNLRVLIVDDNEMSSEILKDQIEAFGLQTATVDSGRAAIWEIKEKSASAPYDLVFMDWRMPEIDGIETTKLILGDKSIKRKPKIVMLSAFGREEVVKKAEKIGIKVFLMKPVSQSLLFDTIMNLSELETKYMPSQRKAKQKGDDLICGIDGLRVLLVEDNVLNQEVASEILSSAGALVEIASNGKEAVDAVKASEYDLVLMDLQMPVMGGYVATRLIRADEKNKDLPIIAMTAHAMQQIKDECIAAGMNDYVSKPIEPDVLFGAIKRSVMKKDICPVIKTPKKAVSAAKDMTAVELPPEGYGIDVETGLKRINGNKKLYRKLLVDFDENYLRSAKDIRLEIGHNNTEAALRLTHTLKGVAGNMSADNIHKAAVEIEAAIMARDADRYDALLSQLDAALSLFHEAVSGLDRAAPESASDIQRAIDPLMAGPVLQELSKLVWEDNIDAEKPLAKLQHMISGKRFEKEVQTISKSISDFDFEAAKAPIKKIAQELDIRLGEHVND